MRRASVSRLELILFPLLILLVCIVFLPAAVPLMGSLALGNFIRECGAVNRLSNAMQNEIMNIATIMLGLGVGMQLEASQFLQPATLGIILIGLLAFSLGTAGGVIFAKIMNFFSPRNPINPLIVVNVSAPHGRASRHASPWVRSAERPAMHAMGQRGRSRSVVVKRRHPGLFG